MTDDISANRPILAVSTRFAGSIQAASETAAVCGFVGVDLAVTPDNIGRLAADREYIMNRLKTTVEVRYHAYFPQSELGHLDCGLAAAALEEYKRVVAAVADEDGKNLTIHIGSNLMEHGDTSFNTAVENLSDLVDFAAPRSVTICVENLRCGMTASPELFAELVEQSNASATIDIGHALSSQAGQNGGFPFDVVARLGSKIKNAHVYEYEDETRGHLPPNGLSVIAPTLNALLTAGCDWWVVELEDPKDIHLTNALINGYFHNKASDKDEISAILAP